MGVIVAIAVVAFALAYAYARHHNGGRRNPVASVGEPLRHVFEKARPFPWLLLLVAFLVLVPLLRGVPLILPVLVVIGLISYLFATAWLREFRFLMRLEDDAFPGRNDKLIWAMLLIIVAPVGVWLFRSYREAHWPSTKRADDRLGDEIV